MTNTELINTTGGAIKGINATFLNAISRGIDACYNLGRACGTALRMLIGRKKCSL